MKPQQTKQAWSEQEKELLTHLTSQFKSKKIDWTLLALQFPNRTQKQIKSYYNNVLRLTLQLETVPKVRSFTQEEDDFIFRFGQQTEMVTNVDGFVRRKWSEFIGFLEFEAHTPKQIASRYFYLSFKQKMHTANTDRSKETQLQEMQDKLLHAFPQTPSTSKTCD